MHNLNHIIYDRTRQGIIRNQSLVYNKADAKIISQIEREIYVGLDTYITYGVFLPILQT